MTKTISMSRTCCQFVVLIIREKRANCTLYMAYRVNKVEHDIPVIQKLRK